MALMSPCKQWHRLPLDFICAEGLISTSFHMAIPESLTLCLAGQVHAESCPSSNKNEKNSSVSVFIVISTATTYDVTNRELEI